MMINARSYNVIVFTILALGVVVPLHAARAQSRGIDARAQRVIDHWTRGRVASAIPRDLVVDERGLSYLRRPDGNLQPYGHDIPAKIALGKPVGGDDTTGPDISNMIPNENTDVGASQLFSAVVKDESGVKSVTFIITNPDGGTQSFKPSYAGKDQWQITLQNFTNGDWQWQVVAKDDAPRGGNTATSGSVFFTVDTTGSGGGGGGGGDDGGSDYIVTNEQWSGGGAVQTAAGRLYFEMPANRKHKGPWNGYVCSGTVVTEGEEGRSVIMTASHCVYDDAYKAFARNVLFIPDQAGTTGDGTDLDCSNDPYGCWVPSFGVVDVNWTTRTFPDNVAWDYAYYVVSDEGAHQGADAASDALDGSVYPLAVSFAEPAYDDPDASSDSDDFTHALGYSYDADPNLMYCAEDMTIEGEVNWWLNSCGLTGGSSGGPWVQPMNIGSGTGPIISVNSWGYVGRSGMAGPKLAGTSAGCVFVKAKTAAFSDVSSADGEAGVAVSCP